MIVRELQISYGPGRQVEYNPEMMNSPQVAADFFRKLGIAAPEEHIFVLFLNAKNRVLGVQKMTGGHVDSCLLSPASIVKRALLANAVGIVLAHNHPSNEPGPSPEDKALTAKLNSLLRELDVKLHDHLIVCEDSYYSFKEAGLL